MLTLRLFLVILVTLLCREVCWHSEAQIESMRALLGVIAACFAFGAVAKVLCVLNLRKFGGFIDEWQHGWQDHSLDRWHSMRQSLETFWVLCLPVTLMLTSWGPWIKQLDELGMLQSVSLVLWFAPSLAALVILELTTSQMEVFIEDSKSRGIEQMQFVVTPKYEGIERRAHLIQVLESSGMAARVPAKLSKVLGTRIRLGGTSNVMACLLPVLLIASASDAMKIMQVDWPESLQSLVASVIGLGAVAIFMPQWLSRWMGVQKLEPGLLRERIDRYSKSLGIRVESMWVASEGRWAGAAVVGWLPGFRQLWLGDALVEQLSDEEVDMVVMHEMAHLKRRHFLWRLIPVVVACAIGLITVSTFSSTSSYAPSDHYIQISGQVTGMMLASGVMLFGISFWSRLCELDADRTACQLAASVCSWARGDAGHAAVTLSVTLVKLHRNSADQDRATWLHPALGQRLARLAEKRDMKQRGDDFSELLNGNTKKRADLVSLQKSLGEAID
jgi:Zn-dependent protease with chaperone function